jgi:hypothetical protein
MRLGNNFNTKVLGGARLHQRLCSTATGTGLGYTTASRGVGTICLDRSSSNWFLCTASAGTGTWVKLNA